MNHHMNFIKQMVTKEGPDSEDYSELDSWIVEMSELAKTAHPDTFNPIEMIEIFGEAFSTETMQGFAYHKPHGYAGDFEIIERIYDRYESPKAALAKWDRYWQRHAAAEAVRNRVTYFRDLIQSHLDARDAPLRVLNLASGPARALALTLDAVSQEAEIHVDCVDQDLNAIQRAKAVCAAHMDRVRFHHTRALRYTSERPYDLIWSAGLFDYFDDQIFVRALKHYASMMAPGGHMVIGNFSTLNPSRAYMDLFQWHLHHRSPVTLRHLAAEAGFDADHVHVGQEPLGVNLFLHLSRP